MFELDSFQQSLLILGALGLLGLLVLTYTLWPYVRWLKHKLTPDPLLQRPRTFSRLSAEGKGEFAEMDSTGEGLAKLLLLSVVPGFRRVKHEGGKFLYEADRSYKEGGFLYCVGIDMTGGPHVMVLGHDHHTARDIVDARESFTFELQKVLGRYAEVKRVAPRADLRAVEAPDLGRRARRTFGRR